MILGLYLRLSKMRLICKKLSKRIRTAVKMYITYVMKDP